MKKLLFVIMVVFCASSLIMAQSGAIKSPKAKDVWILNIPATITWTFSGNAKVKLLLFDKNDVKVGAIKSGLQLNAGSWPWTVGMLEGGKTAPAAKGYKIKLVLADGSGTALDKGAGPFEIAPMPLIAVAPLTPSKPPATHTAVVKPDLGTTSEPELSVQGVLTIHSPHGGDVWKPLSEYEITWEAIKGKYPMSSYAFNVALTAVDNPAFSPLALKKNYWTLAKSTDSSFIYSFNWKFLGSLNIPSGKYKLTVQSVTIPAFKTKTGIITVQNAVSDDTAFIGEDAPDLVIEEIYYDFLNTSMWARMKNQGFGPYTGPLTIDYLFKTDTVTYNTPICPDGGINGKTTIPNITLNKFQSNAYLICKWPCFDKRPADFLPLTGPVKYEVSVSATGKETVSQSGVVCKSKTPDVIVNSSFTIHSKYDFEYFVAFQKTTLDPRHFDWILRDTFESKVQVKVRNWGCQSVQCRIKLYMDGNYLNGKKEVTLGTVSLQCGQETLFVSDPVKFSFPKSDAYQRMLLVAHQEEEAAEGYPDSYRNNFILTYVKFEEKDNTIRGVVDW